MKQSDAQVAISALREAQLILATYIEPVPRDCERTINDLLSVLDRDDVVEAVNRLKDFDGSAMAWGRVTMSGDWLVVPPSQTAPIVAPAHQLMAWSLLRQANYPHFRRCI